MVFVEVYFEVVEGDGDVIWSCYLVVMICGLLSLVGVVVWMKVL